ncbi:MAG: PaaI family thioesterase [Pseudomonadota bacterium]
MDDRNTPTPAHFESTYPLQAHLGFEMRVWDADQVVIQQPIVPHIGNRYGIPHGGVYGVLLDTAMGYAGCFTGDPERKLLAMTLSMTVNFVAQPAGTLLLASARKRGGGRRTFFADGEVRDDLGTLVATGSGAFRYRSG